MVYKIFGKNIKFIFDDIRVENILLDELNLYPQVEKGSIDVEIYFVEKIVQEAKQYISPSNHISFFGGFQANYGRNIVKYIKTDILRIYIEVHDSDFIRKFIGIDFNSSIEGVGEILHELVLIPMIHFFDDLAIIHASSFRNLDTDEVYVIGGTGGVGKTSTEIMFCLKDNFSFISDDIAVVDNEGNIYPNLSFPKIYAYNVDGNDSIKQVILQNDNLIGKFQWYFIKTLMGPKRIRRRLSAKVLYKKYENDKQCISKYFILTKNNLIDKMKKNKFNNLNDVVSVTQKVIENEYHVFYQHVKWHEYNCMLNNITPILTLEDIENRQNYILNKSLQNIENYVVSIPKDISHKDFLLNIEKVLV